MVIEAERDRRRRFASPLLRAADAYLVSQALWINALELGARLSARRAPVLTRARLAFAARFWNPTVGCRYDVVDVDHVPGLNDATLRPNQVFAVGGLPAPLLDGARAR
jgi:glycogen debranching enzyme